MKEAALNILERAINRYVRMSMGSQAALDQFDGKCVRMTLTDLGLSCDILFRKDDVQCSAVSESNPDVVLRGSSATFFRLSVGDDTQQLKLARDLDVEGDVELGQNVHAFFKNIEVDWEEHLSKIVGDVAAHQMGNLVRDVKTFLNKAVQNFQGDLNDYMHEEVRWAPLREEIQAFSEAVDALRNGVERLEARAKHLS